MRLFAASRREPFNEGGQLAGRHERPLPPLSLNRARQTPRLRFPAQFPKNPGQFIHAQLIDQVRRRQVLPRVHPHVQRTVPLKTEPALRRVKLRRTHAQIQQDPVAT